MRDARIAGTAELSETNPNILHSLEFEEKFIEKISKENFPTPIEPNVEIIESETKSDMREKEGNVENEGNERENEK